MADRSDTGWYLDESIVGDNVPRETENGVQPERYRDAQKNYYAVFL
jgi:hypothetical protein